MEWYAVGTLCLLIWAAWIEGACIVRQLTGTYAYDRLDKLERDVSSMKIHIATLMGRLRNPIQDPPFIQATGESAC